MPDARSIFLRRSRLPMPTADEFFDALLEDSDIGDQEKD
jgi:hypothetical protein